MYGWLEIIESIDWWFVGQRILECFVVLVWLILVISLCKDSHKKEKKDG